MADILIIEREHRAARLMAEVLTEAGHVCRIAESIAKAQDHLRSLNYALTIMNARFSWTDSHAFLQNLSERGWPVLFVTCDANTQEHLNALYSGPSRVLVNPFEHNMLCDQVEGILRETESRLTIGSLEINLDEKAVMLAGEPLNLTAQEFALLQALMQNPDTALSREQLLRTAWGYQGIGETRTVDVHVQRLRKKLGMERIETVYKLGYRLRMA